MGNHSYPLSISATDTKDKSIGVSPPEDGTQFGVVEIPPSDPTQSTQSLWRRTRTVDYVVVISGEIDLMLEASVVHLKAGDTVIQQATNHAWVNHGAVECRLLFVLMDAKEPKGDMHHSITTNQAAIIALFRVVTRYVGNLAPMPGVFPDYPARSFATPIPAPRSPNAVGRRRRRRARVGRRSPTSATRHRRTGAAG
jgi:quercetin dioxygenase-like cupin family protein